MISATNLEHGSGQYFGLQDMLVMRLHSEFAATWWSVELSSQFYGSFLWLKTYVLPSGGAAGQLHIETTPLHPGACGAGLF